MEESNEGRGRLLDPVDRVSEILFGLIMAITIVGSLSVATAGRSDVRTVAAAALGCNLAWGMVDAVMYLVRTLTERSRNRMLARNIAGADTAQAHRLILETLPEHVAQLTDSGDLEGMRRKLLALPPPPARLLHGDDYLAALGIFLLVVLATFPVVLPFVLSKDVAFAMYASQAVSLAMLFAAGFVLGRHAGHPRPAGTGFFAMLVGVAVIAAVKALGG
jgi:VIT1/CCC1 family predicted Fe2+/Mn2+ transporter